MLRVSGCAITTSQSLAFRREQRTDGRGRLSTEDRKEALGSPGLTSSLNYNHMETVKKRTLQSNVSPHRNHRSEPCNS